jgi:hypothetical protein
MKFALTATNVKKFFYLGAGASEKFKTFRDPLFLPKSKLLNVEKNPVNFVTQSL